MKPRLCAMALAGVLLVGAAGCADTQTNTSSNDHVSTIPWNRPEKWEGGGALGSMMNQPGR